MIEITGQKYNGHRETIKRADKSRRKDAGEENRIEALIYLLVI